jgi:hypothetical protein
MLSIHFVCVWVKVRDCICMASLFLHVVYALCMCLGQGLCKMSKLMVNKILSNGPNYLVMNIDRMWNNGWDFLGKIMNT